MNQQTEKILLESLERLEEDSAQIKRALFGEPKVSVGLLDKQADNAQRIKRLERWSAALITAGGTIAILWKVFVDATPIIQTAITK